MSDDNSKKSYLKTIMMIVGGIGVLALAFAAYSYFGRYQKIDQTNPDNASEAEKWKNYAMYSGAVGVLACIGAFVLYRKQTGESVSSGDSSEKAIEPQGSNDDDMSLEAEEEQMFQSV